MNHQCCRCKTIKDDNDFDKNKLRPSGLSDYCKICRAFLQKKNYINTYDKYRIVHNNQYLKQTYGISLNDWFEILENQNYKCAICSIHQSDHRKTFHLDHDHTTGKNRALLCEDCNRGLGCFKDKSDILLNASIYLNRYKKECSDAITQ